MEVAHHTGRGFGIDDAAAFSPPAGITGTIRSSRVRMVDCSRSGGGSHAAASLVGLKRPMHGR